MVAVRLHGGDGENCRTHGDGRHFRLFLGNIRTKVRFCQQYHRVGSAFPCDGEIALQPPQVEIVVQAHAQKHGVDVGGHHLFRLGSARRPAHKHAFAGKHLMDDGGIRVSAVGQHIIAHGGVIGHSLGVELKPAGHKSVLLAHGGAEPVQPLFLQRDPSHRPSRLLRSQRRPALRNIKTHLSHLSKWASSKACTDALFSASS